MSSVAINPAVVSRLGIPDTLALALGAKVTQSRVDINVLIQQLGALSGDTQCAVSNRARDMVPCPRDALAQTGGASHGMNAYGGVAQEAPFGRGKLGRSIEKALQKDPALKGKLEKMLGGTILPDCKKDGVLTVFRAASPTVAQQLRQALKGGVMANTGCAQALASCNANVATNGGVVGRCMNRMGANMTAMAQSMRGNDGLPMDTRNMSFEDMVHFLLMKYAAKKEKEILNKVQQLDKGGAASGATGSGGGVDKGAWSQMGSTMQAQMGASGGAQDFGGVQGDPSKMSDTMKQQLLQKLMSDLQKMYEMLSNMMKSMHDMQMTPIRALKG